MRGSGLQVSFDVSTGLPPTPSGHRLSKIKYATCPGSDLVLQLTCVNGDDKCDPCGMSEDSWWCVRCCDLPDRHLRLYNGTQSMRGLLRRYGFMDGTGCVNHKKVVATYKETDSAKRCAPPKISPHLKEATGIPQFYPRSGVCWFAALCTISFADPKVREFLKSHFPPQLQGLCDTCLFRREDAQKLRNVLWTDYSIGDNIEDRPENDGCNGFSEFTLMCAKMSIPLLRYREVRGRFTGMPPDLSDKRGAPVRILPPSTKRPHLLVIRFQDGDHSRFPLLRRILVNGVRYRWVGCYAGQRKCGHQIGIASADGCWRHLIIGDADLHKDGVGPVHINFEGDKWRNKKAWWGALEYLVHVTKFGPDLSEFCNLSPHNRPDDELDKYRGQKRGKNSIDMLYFSDHTGSHGDSLSGDSFRSSSTRSSPLERTTRGSFPRPYSFRTASCTT